MNCYVPFGIDRHRDWIGFDIWTSNWNFPKFRPHCKFLDELRRSPTLATHVKKLGCGVAISMHGDADQLLTRTR
jgi:hypothetical protein